MKGRTFVPCPEWAEKLAAMHWDDLLPSDRVALAKHIASCPACAAVRSEYQAMHTFIRDVSTDDPPPRFPPKLLQLWRNQIGSGGDGDDTGREPGVPLSPMERQVHREDQERVLEDEDTYTNGMLGSSNNIWGNFSSLASAHSRDRERKRH